MLMFGWAAVETLLRGRLLLLASRSAQFRPVVAAAAVLAVITADSHDRRAEKRVPQRGEMYSHINSDE